MCQFYSDSSRFFLQPTVLSYKTNIFNNHTFKNNIIVLRLYDTMLNFVENLLENERGPMNDQDLKKTDYDPDRSLVLIEGLSHFLTNFLQNLALCQTSFKH
jgi:hypothetical protein